MKEILSPDAYREYRELESQKKARLELVTIQDFLDQSGIRLSGEQAAVVFEAVNSNNTVTATQWHGAYDPMPRPLFGKEIVPFLEGEIQRVGKSSAATLEALSPVLPKEVVNQISSYFNDRMESWRKSIVIASAPPKTKEDLAREVQEREMRQKGRQP
jgi:hypothetical protein